MTEAENTRARLALLGFEAAVTDRNTDNGLLHRVRVGPFGGLEAMNRVRAKMAENGVDVAVVRNQKQSGE
jgi:cell division protein FtsN